MIDEKVLMFWLQNKSVEYLATAFKGVDPEKAKAKIELISEIIAEFKLDRDTTEEDLKVEQARKRADTAVQGIRKIFGEDVSYIKD